MNDLPPRLEPRPVDRRDSSKREQLKADLDQRQKLADELDTGRAAQLALKEILDTVRNAEASATGRHLFDEFDFFQQSFPALCLRLLSPSAQHDSSLVITANDSWSSTIPWDRQKDALSRVVEARGQFLRRKDSLLSTTYDETSSASINLDKFHDHITKVFDLWRSLPDRNRHDIWQREILRSYARMENDLKEARSTIAALKRDAELMSKRLSRGNNILSPAQGAFETSMQYTQSPISMSNDALKDLGRQGLSTREWEYERLLDRWKNIVREERRSSSGLQAQRNFATPSTRAMDAQGTLAINGARGSTASRSASVTSAMSAAAPTRTESIDSAGQDADAEGEERTWKPIMLRLTHTPILGSPTSRTRRLSRTTEKGQFMYTQAVHHTVYQTLDSWVCSRHRRHVWIRITSGLSIKQHQCRRTSRILIKVQARGCHQVQTHGMPSSIMRYRITWKDWKVQRPQMRPRLSAEVIRRSDRT